MRRMWLALLILACVVLAQNIALSIHASLYHHRCDAVREVSPC